MSRIIRTSRSNQDIHEIAAYISSDNGRAALALVEKFDSAVKTLAASPQLGRAQPQLGPSIRVFPVGRYSIYYLPITDGIALLRVLHGAQDIRRKFKN